MSKPVRETAPAYLARLPSHHVPPVSFQANVGDDDFDAPRGAVPPEDQADQAPPPDLSAEPLFSLYGLEALRAAGRINIPLPSSTTQQPWQRNASATDATALQESLRRLRTYVPSPPAPPANASLRIDPVPDRPNTYQAVAIVAGPPVQEHPVAAGANIPYIRLQVRPTLQQTVGLFTLSTQQAAAFLLIGRTFLQDHAHQMALNEAAPGRPVAVPPAEPLRLIIQGGPGTGKSRIIQAAKWFMWQYDWPDWMCTTGYTWCSVLVNNTAHNRGLSTTTLFQLGSARVAHDKVRLAFQQHGGTLPSHPPYALHLRPVFSIRDAAPWCCTTFHCTRRD